MLLFKQTPRGSLTRFIVYVWIYHLVQWSPDFSYSHELRSPGKNYVHISSAVMVY